MPDDQRVSAETRAGYARLRRHLIEAHGFDDGYFDEDYPVGGPITDLATLRWLHQPWVYPRGCDVRG